MKTKLYIATDSSPVDVHTYELCADLVDVVIDVSYIYGLKKLDAQGNTSVTPGGRLNDQPSTGPSTVLSPYDESSTSAIRLNNGMVLYLREASEYLALVCLLREENFAKRSLVDYNIDCLKLSLSKILQIGRDNWQD